MSDKDTIYAYLKQNKYMAMATATRNGAPQVATVEYVMDGDVLLVSTSVKYRKYPNLVDNPRVACVVTTGHERTLQFEAVVRQLGGAEADDAKAKMLEFEPDFADFFSQDTRFFKLTPTWMRLRDYTKTPTQASEYLPKEDMIRG